MRVLPVFALLLWASATAQAQRTLEIQRFDAGIAVNADGSIDVSETIRARFTGSWNGIYRVIPVKYRTDAGLNWTIRISLTSATDERGTALKTETSRNGALLKYKIWVPGAQDTTRTITLRFHALNALRFFDALAGQMVDQGGEPAAGLEAGVGAVVVHAEVGF